MKKNISDNLKALVLLLFLLFCNENYAQNTIQGLYNLIGEYEGISGERFDNVDTVSTGIWQRCVTDIGFPYRNTNNKIVLLTNGNKPYSTSNDSVSYFLLRLKTKVYDELIDKYRFLNICTINWSQNVDIASPAGGDIEFSLDGTKWYSIYSSILSIESNDTSIISVSSRFDYDYIADSKLPVNGEYYSDSQVFYYSQILSHDTTLTNYKQFNDLHLRFSFVSGENINNHQGWLLENIFIHYWYTTIDTTRIYGNTKKTDNERILVYPNPILDKKVKIITCMKESIIEVVNITGIIMFSALVSEEEYSLNLVNYIPGIYFVLITDVSTGRIYQRKIVVN